MRRDDFIVIETIGRATKDQEDGTYLIATIERPHLATTDISGKKHLNIETAALNDELELLDCLRLIPGDPYHYEGYNGGIYTMVKIKA